MKRLLILKVIIFCLPFYLFCQSPNVKGSYKYPIQPGSAEWKSMKDRSERVAACQIPNDILNKLTTLQLLETCLNNPFMVDILAFNNVQVGFEKIASEFNGLQEFLRRKDNSIALLSYYSQIDPNSIDNLNPGIERGIIPLKMTYIEMLLLQEEVLNNFSEVSEIVAIEELVNKYEAKKANSYYQGGHSFSILAMSLDKNLKRSKEKKSNLKSPQIKEEGHVNAALNPDLICNEAKEYLRNLKTNQK